MQGWGVWTGLGRSAFLADVGPRDRDPMRLLITLVVGLAVAFLAAIAGWIVIMAPETILAGYGEQGVGGLGPATAALADPRQGGLGVTVLRLLVTLGSDSVFLLAFVAVAAAVAGHALKRYATAAARLRWRLLLAGLTLAMLALAPVAFAERMMSTDAGSLPMMAISGDLGGRLVYVAATALFIPLAAAEELFFRGWLLRLAAGVSRRPSILIVGTALAFSALHLDFTANGFITRALMGAGLAYMTLRLGGIEFAVGVHAANNILIVLFIQPLSLASPQAGGGVDFGSILESGVLLAGYVAITEAVARIAPLRRMLGVEPGEVSAAAAFPVQPG